METEIKFCPRCGAEIAHLTSGYVCPKCGLGEGGINDIVEIPFGAHDSELQHWEYTIPEGMEARIEGNKVVLEPKNEDESIRNRIIGYLKQDIEEYPERKERIDGMIAYLEKQKEHLPVPDKFSGLKSLMLQYLQSAANRKDDTDIESDTDLFGRKILDYVWKHDEKQKEQKPAEWSKEDYVRVYEPRPGTMISTAIRDAIEEARKSNECLILRFNGVCLSVEKNSNPDTLEKMYHRRWKPSEEQMIYLKEAINKFDFCDAENAGLQALYEQLKKLK